MNNPSDNDYKRVATITAIVGCIIAAIALIPAFGEWLQERQAAQQAAVPTPTATSVCEVPSLVGRSQPDAEQRLAVLGLRVIVSAGEPSEVPAGTVMAQRPDVETRLEPCAGEIRLIVSPGLPPTNTPLPTDTPVPPTATPVPPTATPVPPTPTPESPNYCPWSFQIYNVTNSASVATMQLNQATVAQVPDSNGLFQDTSYIDISSQLATASENILRFSVINASGSSAGFRLRLGDQVVIDEQTSSASEMNPYDKSFVLTPDCGYYRIEPSPDKWEVHISYENHVYGTIYVDGVNIARIGGREGSGTVNISPYILTNRRHRITIRGRETAPMNGGGRLGIAIFKNETIVLQRSFHERDTLFGTFHVDVLPDGRLELN